MMKRLLIALTLSAAANSVFAASDHTHIAAIGTPGLAVQVSQTIALDMDDTMRFTPARITVKRGQTVKFLLKNSGQLKHEMVLGSVDELQQHAIMMREHPDMQHAEANQLALDGGQRGRLIWRFNQAGTFDFACLQAGHFEAGMQGQVVVE